MFSRFAPTLAPQALCTQPLVLDAHHHSSLSPPPPFAIGSLGASTICFVAPSFIYWRIFAHHIVGRVVAALIMALGLVVVVSGIAHVLHPD
jgi:hypothetical protein